MTRLLIDTIQQHVLMTPEEQESIPLYFERLKIRRHQYLLQEGQVCRHEYFVLKGCCR